MGSRGPRARPAACDLTFPGNRRVVCGRALPRAVFRVTRMALSSLMKLRGLAAGRALGGMPGPAPDPDPVGHVPGPPGVGAARPGGVLRAPFQLRSVGSCVASAGLAPWALFLQRNKNHTCGGGKDSRHLVTPARGQPALNVT